MNNPVPLDVRPRWLNVARRLQSVARSQGLSILTITVLVNADGDPLFWLEPKQHKVEPKAAPEELLALLTGGDNRRTI